MTRLVIDASVLVSAVAARGGHPFLTLEAVRAGEIEMIACPHLLEEVDAAL